MKQKVKSLLVSTTNPCIQLNLIDAMQRLGVGYHFEDEILETLTRTRRFEAKDLYTTALHFRILRQNGIMVSPGVFERFRDGSGKFMENLKEDRDGILSLYEASYLGMEGEDLLEEARIFSTEHLKTLLVSSSDKAQAKEVKEALEVPSHWRMRRYEHRSFIDTYQNKSNKCVELLEFAKLDYNIVQSIYHMELKELARWWRKLSLKEKLPFSRDRLMELYLWSMGMAFEPQLSQCRIDVAKLFSLATYIDDTYDVYGSIEELEIFTQAINGWDIGESMENLPQYMRTIYLALFSFCQELQHKVLQKHGIDVLPHITNLITEQCEAYLVEAKWFWSGYTPSFKECLENSWISVGTHPVIAVGYYLCLDGFNSKESAEHSKQGHELIYWASLIARLADDLSTAESESERGDVTKSIECYMIEKEVNEEEAKEHIKSLIRHSWKKLNEESFKKTDIQERKGLKNLCLNMARAAQFMYQYGDGVGESTGIYKDLINSLIVEPIPMAS